MLNPRTQCVEESFITSRTFNFMFSLSQERVSKANGCSAHPQGHLQPFRVDHQLLSEKHLLCAVWQWEHRYIPSGNGQAGHQVRIPDFWALFFLTVLVADGVGRWYSSRAFDVESVVMKNETVFVSADHIFVPLSFKQIAFFTEYIRVLPVCYYCSCFTNVFTFHVQIESNRFFPWPL